MAEANAEALINSTGCRNTQHYLLLLHVGHVVYDVDDGLLLVGGLEGHRAMVRHVSEAFGRGRQQDLPDCTSPRCHGMGGCGYGIGDRMLARDAPRDVGPDG